MSVTINGTTGVTTPNATTNTVVFPVTQVPSTDPNTLDDYEEGTWTPNQGAGLTVVGAFSSSGTYTKIGRMVVVNGIVIGATSISVSAGGVLCSNLPFTAGHVGMGSIMNAQTGDSGGAMYCSGNNANSVVALGPATNLDFTCTYFV